MTSLNFECSRAIPESALYEQEDEEEDYGDSKDDERSGTRYSVRPFVFHDVALPEHLNSMLGSMSSLLLGRCMWRCCSRTGWLPFHPNVPVLILSLALQERGVDRTKWC